MDVSILICQEKKEEIRTNHEIKDDRLFLHSLCNESFTYKLFKSDLFLTNSILNYVFFSSSNSLMLLTSQGNTRGKAKNRKLK